MKYYYGGDVFGRQPGWPQDYRKAFELWSDSAQSGTASSQFMLGVMYMLGQGVALDRAEAYAWFNLALSGGYLMATDSLVELSRQISADEKQRGRLLLEEMKARIGQDKAKH